MKVSIITPTYNSSQFICETIDSILNQSYIHWELLITDDCSNDNTWDILLKYAKKDSRIKIFGLDKNSGAGIARNNSIKEASGKYIAFCDSDDIWLPNKLECQINFMEKNNYDLSFSSCSKINEQRKHLGEIKAKNKVSYKIMLRNNYIPCLTAMYNVHTLGKQYMSEIRKRQDWALWLKILKQTNFAYGIQEPLAQYRIREKSLSSSKLTLLKSNWNIYKNVEGFSKLKSSHCITRFLFFYFLYKIFKI